eukprot:7542801-Pyramimonas_sp.AAC.1
MALAEVIAERDQFLPNERVGMDSAIAPGAGLVASAMRAQQLKTGACLGSQTLCTCGFDQLVQL